MNRERRIILTTLTGLALFFLSAALAWSDCEQEESEAYKRAIAPGVSTDEKISLLSAANKTCTSFAIKFELARAYYAKGDQEKAISVLEDAKSLAAFPPDKSNGFLALARIYVGTHQPENALLYYRSALAQFPDREDHVVVEREMMGVEKSLPAELSAKAITAFLGKGLANRAFGVRPAVDVRVNFTLDSSTFTEEGKRQIEELGRALASPELKGRSFTLIGHTDVRGTDQHNDALSLKRVQAVKAYLLQNYAITPSSIDTKAMGKRQPLYHENTEDAHAMNRRVEVEVR